MEAVQAQEGLSLRSSGVCSPGVPSGRLVGDAATAVRPAPPSRHLEEPAGVAVDDHPWVGGGRPEPLGRAALSLNGPIIGHLAAGCGAALRVVTTSLVCHPAVGLAGAANRRTRSERGAFPLPHGRRDPGRWRDRPRARGPYGHRRPLEARHRARHRRAIRSTGRVDLSNAAARAMTRVTARSRRRREPRRPRRSRACSRGREGARVTVRLRRRGGLTVRVVGRLRRGLVGAAT